MKQPKALIIGGNGINADAELAEAFRLAGAAPDRRHVNDLVAEPSIIDDFSIVGFPGGFSYGDHLGSGQVLALLCRRGLKESLGAFVARGGVAIGICNGFQALVKMGMLPNRSGAWDREVSLVHNASGSFLDDWVDVRFESGSRCVWTAGGLEPRPLPIRHGEGRFVARDAATLAALERDGLVVMRYGKPGSVPGTGNPNGSEADIAGLCDGTGRVLGIMPHPEAYLVRENGPFRRRSGTAVLGLDLFEKGVAAARSAS